MSNVTNILLTGVGGQGILLASRIISTVAMKAGLDVKSADVHGMAQRGGSVTSQIRVAEHVFSPMIPEGEVDYLVALEKLEAHRYTHLVSEEGKVFVNTQVIKPPSVTMGMASYPEDVEDQLRAAFKNLIMIDCISIGKELGNTRVSNTVLLGALSTHLDFEPSLWEDTIKELVKPKFVDMNLEAFRRGKELGQ